MGDPKTQDRLPELDALRGIAALIVVLFHYTWRAHNKLSDLQTIPYGLAWGHYGVELFFAISGFVIFMTLERTRQTADFIVSRFSRLFPAFWAGILVTTSAVTLLGAGSLAQPANVILANFTMLQGFLYLPSVDGVYCSLTVELGFYACMLALWRGGLCCDVGFGTCRSFTASSPLLSDCCRIRHGPVHPRPGRETCLVADPRLVAGAAPFANRISHAGWAGQSALGMA